MSSVGAYGQVRFQVIIPQDVLEKSFENLKNLKKKTKKKSLYN